MFIIRTDLTDLIQIVFQVPCGIDLQVSEGLKVIKNVSKT